MQLMIFFSLLCFVNLLLILLVIYINESTNKQYCTSWLKVVKSQFFKKISQKFSTCNDSECILQKNQWFLQITHSIKQAKFIIPQNA